MVVPGTFLFPDEPQVKPKEEDHSQYLSSSETVNPTAKPKNGAAQKEADNSAKKESGK